MEQILSKVIKRRKRPSFEPKIGKAGSKKKAEESSSSEDEEDAKKPDWEMARDPSGNLCWHNPKTGQVTYGNSYGAPQPVYNPALAQRGFDDDDDDDDDKKDRKGKQPAAARAAAAAAPAIAPVAVMHPGHMHHGGGMGYMPSPVHPMGYMPSPVHYGMSPVAMYPAAPWNAMPASPVPMQVPEYVKKQHAEAQKAKKKKEEAEKKRIALGVWERFYTDDGGKFWQHSVTGKKVSQDPYR